MIGSLVGKYIHNSTDAQLKAKGLETVEAEKEQRRKLSLTSYVFILTLVRNIYQVLKVIYVKYWSKRAKVSCL